MEVCISEITSQDSWRCFSLSSLLLVVGYSRFYWYFILRMRIACLLTIDYLEDQYFSLCCVVLCCWYYIKLTYIRQINRGNFVLFVLFVFPSHPPSYIFNWYLVARSGGVTTSSSEEGTSSQKGVQGVRVREDNPWRRLKSPGRVYRSTEWSSTLLVGEVTQSRKHIFK